jgi:hypothetical protein
LLATLKIPAIKLFLKMPAINNCKMQYFKINQYASQISLKDFISYLSSNIGNKSPYSYCIGKISLK